MNELDTRLGRQTNPSMLVNIYYAFVALKNEDKVLGTKAMFKVHKVYMVRSEAVIVTLSHENAISPYSSEPFTVKFSFKNYTGADKRPSSFEIMYGASCVENEEFSYVPQKFDVQLALKNFWKYVSRIYGRTVILGNDRKYDMIGLVHALRGDSLQKNNIT